MSANLPEPAGRRQALYLAQILKTSSVWLERMVAESRDDEAAALLDEIEAAARRLRVIMDRQTNRQPDRQTNRQPDRQTDRQPDRQAGPPTAQSGARQGCAFILGLLLGAAAARLTGWSQHARRRCRGWTERPHGPGDVTGRDCV